MPGNRPDVAGYLSQYNSSFLEEIEKAGVDTQTGLFKRTVGILLDLRYILHLCNHIV